MPIKIEIDTKRRRVATDKLASLAAHPPPPPPPRAPIDGKPVLLPKVAGASPTQARTDGVNASPQLSSATALLSLSMSSPHTSASSSRINSTASPLLRDASPQMQARKAVHLASEKKRRQNISDGFSDLRLAITSALLPSTTTAVLTVSDSKAAILRKAAVAINEQTEEIKRLRTHLYGGSTSSKASRPRTVTLVSEGHEGGGSASREDDDDVMESAATLTSLKHLSGK